MKNPTCYLIAICLLLLPGCSKRTDGTKPIIPIKFERSEAIDLGQFVDNVKFVQLETKPESAFTDIDKLIVSGSKIFILDKRLEAVFCYDTAGKFNFRIQRIGRGPGEYKELDAIWVRPAKEELWLQSFWPPMIMVYNFKGDLLREFKIRWPARDMTGIGDDLIIGYNNSRSSNGKDSLLEGVFLLSDAGKYKDQTIAVGGSSVYWTLNYQRNLEQFGQGALLLCQSDTLFKINELGVASPEVLLDWGKLRFPDNLRKIGFNSPRYAEALTQKFVSGKDHLVAFGPIRLFRIILNGHMELAMADLNQRMGSFSDRISSSNVRVPLMYPIAKSDRDELIGLYSIDLLMAYQESRASRPKTQAGEDLYHTMDSLVESALIQNCPVLWLGKIKNEWLNKSY